MQGSLHSLLLSVFALVLSGVAFFAWFATDYLLAVPILVFAAALVLLLSRSASASLLALILGFIVMLGRDAGFQPQEVAYGVIFYSFISYWLISRTLSNSTRVITSKIDGALFLFLSFSIISVCISFLFEYDPILLVSEWVAISMLAIYFPVKAACRADRKMAAKMLVVLGIVTAFITVRNFYLYLSHLSLATYVWQIEKGRVTLNEHLLMIAAVYSFAFLIYTEGWGRRLVLFVLCTGSIAGVILGQSRALWISLLLGVVVIFILVEAKQRFTILTMASVAITLASAAGLLFFKGLFYLIVTGLAQRFASLGTAASHDDSLVNRFYEYGAAWSLIKKNPVVGYGLGVPYDYYSMVYENTHHVSFIHNGYLSIWYKHGLVGLVLMLTFWFGTIIKGSLLFRDRSAALSVRCIGLSCAAAFTAEALGANTENPFASLQTMFVIGLLAGIVAGLYERAKGHKPLPHLLSPTD